MTSKSIGTDYPTNTGFDAETTQPTSVFMRCVKRIVQLFRRSELEKIQSANRRRQSALHSGRQDILCSLSLNDKMRLGMYHWID